MTIDPKKARARLHKAWDAASEWLTTRPTPWTSAEASDHARALALSVQEYIEATDDLTTNEGTVLGYVAAVAADRGSDRITLSRSALVEETGLGLTALRTALRRLDENGILVCVEPGAARSKGRPPRANVYRLALPTQSENPISGAPLAISGAPDPVPSGISGAPAHIGLDDVRRVLGDAAVQQLLRELADR